MARISNIAVVILAAGDSSRMQRTKQLLPWGDSTLLGTAINAGLESNCEKVFVVLGSEAESIKSRHSDSQVHWLLNTKWKGGMGTSINCAVKHILGSDLIYEGILVMLCDQPYVDAKYLRGMIEVFENSRKGIVATAYKKRSGVPVIFHRKYFNELAGLAGDTGARIIVAEHERDTITMVPNGKEKDLDTFEAYQQALKNTTF